MSKKQGGKSKMSDALTIARLCIASAAGERGFNDTRQSWLARAARRLGFAPGRITSIWYDKGVRLSADELLQMMKERCAEQAWQQLRAEERLHDQANQISILASGNIPPHQRRAAQAERPGNTDGAGAGTSAPDAKG